ncbi:hypothetical protein [Sphingorhabdus sp. M41]|uniref:hypothetical protein n=1 Tax=Sphingorhabdus sp. M41 TaxID=1806885 RepID=UPI00078C80C0|nr:hypothetical protein [Sphingorhabdus sp. M41]AMO72496.1 hypothetical protein AZE99_12110 [Sphingorhabdus sp. M41]
MMTGSSSPGIWQRFCRLLKPDWMFGFILLVGMGLLAVSIFDPNEVRPGSVTPLTKVVGAALLVLLLSYVATYAAALDRRKLEDYFFQMMANGAIVAIISAIFANMVWLVFEKQLGTMSAGNLVAILISAWGFGYFFYRIRGLNQ